jgi:DNA modification methylase
MRESMKLTFETWPIERCIDYARNPRKNDHAVDKVAAAIKEFGFRVPIVAKSDGLVVDGHLRLKAAKKLGLTEVPVILADDMTEAQIKAFRLSVNKVAELADWDTELLALEFGELDEMGFDLSLTGFEADEIGALFPEEAKEGLTEDDAVPEIPAVPATREGDVWLLGRHRLMCGDSTSIDAVDKLMAGRKADMVFTDPPYGIAYSSEKFAGNKAGVTNKRNKAEMILGDADDFDPSFLVQIFKGAKEMFVWGYQYYPDKLGRGGIIVWNKKRETEAANPHGDFELCWSRKERNKMCWLQWGGFKNKEKGEDRLHTTQKPVALALWFFENWGNGLTCVVDLFGGSGSTLIACEKTARDCRMMELDPKYCDVIIKRWQDFTGQQATLEATGQTFAELSDEREAA